MRRVPGLLLALLLGSPTLLTTSCGDAQPARLPPPLPASPPPAPRAEEAPDTPAGEDEARPAKRPASNAKGKPRVASRSERAVKASRNDDKAASPGREAPAVEPTKAPAKAVPAAAPPSGASKPVKSSRVTVPQLPHVRAEVPDGLQRDLDADPRMQSWLDRVFAVIDGCHAQNRGATGTIEAQITMHENERPDADIRSLPPALSSVVACATGGLMRTKMPLFTGREGARYPVRIRFQ